MRRRIMLLVAGITVLVVAAFVIPLAILIRHQVYDDAVGTLRAQTNQLALQLRSTFATPSNAQLTADLAEVSKGLDASVQLADGTVLGRTPPGGFPPGQPGGGASGDGGSGAAGAGGGGAPAGRGGPPGPQPATRSWHGGQLATLSTPFDQSSQQNATVRIWASDGYLHSGENGWWLLLGGGAIGLLALGMLAAELLTRRLVRPLAQTAATAHRLGAGDTAARAPTSGPAEIAEVGAALNRLADRIDQLIAEERESAADLSHRLRTPLTALRLDADALRDPSEAARIGAHASELERALTALIRAARRPQREGRLPITDATAVVGDRVRFWSALAEEQHRTVRVELPAEPLPVRAAADDLGAALDALLENVIAHTPEGVGYAVRLAATPDGARLNVADDGPGLPDPSPSRGRSDRGSSGLGLDIARRCAEAAGGTMRLGRAASGGALITLTFCAP